MSLRGCRACDEVVQVPGAPLRLKGALIRQRSTQHPAADGEDGHWNPGDRHLGVDDW
jgi:hypothetical protein